MCLNFRGSIVMKKFFAVVLAGLFSVGVAQAQTAAPPMSMSAQASSTCESQAIGKDGKALSGAAKTSFMKKCESNTKTAMAPSCESKAIDKNGKALAGAAKTSFMKKCETSASK
jgi:hypothetical protein